MPARFRAGLIAALFLFVAAPLTSVSAAEKPFQDSALDDAAIKLQADLKEEAGTVEKPVISLRKEADAALKLIVEKYPESPLAARAANEGKKQ